jgi:prepilin-type N-terminal cleavage/methylation domain-containing protein
MTRRTASERGFSLTEVIAAIGLIGVLCVMSVPNMLRYWQTSTLNAGAAELATVMARARALAVTLNTAVCVQVTGTTVTLRLVNCAGTLWTGPGTDSGGVIQLSNNLQIGGGAAATFTNFGGALPTATFTVTDPKTGLSRSVVITATGRVTVQ